MSGMTQTLRRLGLLLSTVAVLMAATAGPALAEGPWVNDPQGPIAKSIADLYWVMFVIAVIVLAIVVGALVYAGIRFRERPGHVARQYHSNNLLEIIWTIIPTLIVVSLAVLSFQRLLYINDVDSDAAMVVNVEGKQWVWAFSYPSEAKFKLSDNTYLQGAEEIHIPVGQKVKLALHSKDVIHAFWVPGLGGQKDAVPGRETALWIQADRAGTFKGQCSEFCGDGHGDMLITVIAHDPQDYDKWAQSAVAKANLFNDPSVKQGKELFTSLACAGCHTVKGLSGGKVGPELTDIARTTNPRSIAGVLKPVNQENLEKWITKPSAVKPGTKMPDLGLDAATVTAISKFLLTLDGKQ
ncbi:MAG: cytochrome c oxidase subunit II [Candidatus Limnocylindrales bacterium]